MLISEAELIIYNGILKKRMAIFADGKLMWFSVLMDIFERTLTTNRYNIYSAVK